MKLPVLQVRWVDHDFRRRRDRAPIGKVVIGSILLGTLASFGVMLGGAPSMAHAPPPLYTVNVVQHRICPVANCAAYLDPEDARGLNIATLQNWLLYVKTAEVDIRAMPSWNMNFARLQIEQDRLIHAQNERVDEKYLNAVRTVVHYALVHHKYVVLNAQTELTVGYWRNEPMPTLNTFRFWHILVNLYRSNPHVILDLFNEPRAPHPWNGDWTYWQHDFQALVDAVRRWGSTNQIWIEGENYASTLQGVPLIRGQGLVYEFHHPGCPHPWECDQAGDNGKKGLDPAIWQQDFGYLTGIVPLIDGEFVNYLGGYYWPRSTTNVTRYFEFLHFHHIGLGSWTLQPGIMTTAHVAVPMREPVSAGELFWKYFHGTLGTGRPQEDLSLRRR